MKHKKDRLAALLSVQSKPKQVSAPTERLTDRQKFDLEQAAEFHAKVIAPQNAVLAQEFARHEDAAREYWSQPVNKLGEALERKDFMTYLGVDFPKTSEPRPHEGREAFVDSYEEIQRRTGMVLSPVGKQRLLFMAVHQCLAQNADLSNIETYILCFNKLVEWEAFEQSGTLELGYDENKKEIVHEDVTPKKLSVDDIENLDTSTRDGAAQAKAIIADAVFGENGEFRAMWNQWLAHLRRDYNFVPDETAQKAVIELFFIRANKSFLSYEDYNAARRWATSNGVFPPDMLTEDERLSAAIEASTATDYETQRRLKQQVVAARRR